eukprot:3989447-Amphidinium_carterae.1
MGVDVMATALRLAHRCLEARAFDVELSDGTCLQGEVHKEWLIDGVPQLMGRVLDLKDAYKQLVVAKGSRKYSCIGVFDPLRNQCRFFVQVTVPFGGKSSVLGFNR